MGRKVSNECPAWRGSLPSRRCRAELGDHQGELAGQVADAGQEDDAGDEQGGEDGEHAGGEVLGILAGPGDRHGADGREEPAEPVAIESRWAKVSMTQPVIVGDQRSPRTWPAARTTPKPTPRMLGMVTPAMMVKHGTTTRNIAYSARKSPA